MAIGHNKREFCLANGQTPYNDMSMEDQLEGKEGGGLKVSLMERAEDK